MRFPNKSDSTGILGILISIAAGVAILMLPWDIPLGLKHTLFWVSVGLCFALLQWLGHLHVLESRTRRQKIYVHLSGVIVFIAVISIVEVPRILARVNPQLVASSQDSSTDYSIEINCELVTASAMLKDNSGGFAFQTVNPPANGQDFGSSFTMISQIEGANIDKLIRMFPHLVWKCVASNYGADKVLSLDGTALIEWVKNPIVLPRDIIATSNFPISLWKFGLRGNQSENFYIYNFGQYFVDVKIGPDVSVLYNGENSKRPVKLSNAGIKDFTMVPFVIKDHPRLFAPFPVLPEPPGKK